MVNASYAHYSRPTLAAGFMMNKSLRGGRRESSSKAEYGFRRVRRNGHARCLPYNFGTFLRLSWGCDRQKKSRRFRRLLKLITGRRQTEWTGATRCPNEDNASHKGEGLMNRKKANIFNFH
jgi:hypothetical protein